MKDYIVVNKTTLIDWMKKESEGLTSPTKVGMSFMMQEVLAQGKPLQPIIEDALEHGFESFEDIDRNYDPSENQEGIDEMKSEYLENLKIE